MDDPERFFTDDAYARQAGIVLLESSLGRARGKMEIRDTHLNSHGTVHAYTNLGIYQTDTYIYLDLTRQFSWILVIRLNR